jgi:type I restriction enzyme S subunit
VLPSRGLFDEAKDRDHADEQMLSVTITRGVIKQRALLEGSSKRDSSNQDKSAYKLVCPGDLAYNKMRAWQGAVGVSGLRGIVSPAYVVVRLRSANTPRYFHHLFRTPGFAKEAERWSYGITSDMWSLRPEHFKMIRACVPPGPEQASIVRFLDHVDRRIRRYIRAKQKLIRLLEEQKQAIIHRAVTRGLDPNVRLKPSGVEWLGDVPEHWEVARLKVVTSHIVDCVHATPVSDVDGEYPAIRTADIEPGYLRLRTARRVNHAQYLGWTARLEPREGDVLYTREGERYGLATLVPPDVKLCISQRMMVFRVRGSPSSAYVMWQLNCPDVYAQASQDIGGATAPHVNVERIRNYAIVLPPLGEQRQIASWIDTESQGLDVGRAGAEREITLLREYRTRLVADVVTGKLDVREVAARLPEEPPEAEEPERLDEVEAIAGGDDGAEGDGEAEGAELETATEEAEA